MMIRLLYSAVALIWSMQSSDAFAPASSSSFASTTRLHAFAPLGDVLTSTQPLIDSTLASAASSSSLDLSAGILSTENIKVAFSVATFFPQLPWLFLILLPNAGVTKKLLGGYGQ